MRQVAESVAIMPCRYDMPVGNEDKATINRLRKDLDKLTAENDMLREAVLNLTRDREFELDPAVVKIIAEDQTKHRAADLKRLRNVFIKNRDAERLGLVMLADPKKPLEEQLGFSPDAY
jgi:hypothetical protein